MAARSQPTQLERIVSLEEQRKSTDRRLDSVDSRLASIDLKLDGLISVLTQAKGIRWLLTVLASFAGVTAATVTATIAAMRYFTGH